MRIAWKKKYERNEIVCFYCGQFHIVCGIAKFSQGNKNKLRTFQSQKWKKKKKKLRTASFKQNLLVLIKKECIAWFKTNKPWRLKSRSTSTSWPHRHCCGAIPTLAPKAMVVIFLDKHVSVHSITFITTILEESFMIGYAPFWYQMETYNFIS